MFARRVQSGPRSFCQLIVLVAAFGNVVDVSAFPIYRVLRVQDINQAVHKAGWHELKAEDALRKAPTQDVNRSNEVLVS